MPVFHVEASGSGGNYHFTYLDKEFDELADSISNHEFQRKITDSDRMKLSRLSDIARQRGLRQLGIRAQYWKIRLNQLDAPPDSCIHILERLRSSTDKDYDYDYACITYQLAGNYQRIGDYYATYQLLQEALPIFEKYNDNYFIGNARLLMGLVYSNIGEHELADEEIENARMAYSLCGYPLNRIYYFKAMIEKDPDKRVGLYKKSLDSGLDDPGMTIQSYMNIAAGFREKHNSDSAASYLEMGKIMYNDRIPDNKPLGSLLLLLEAQILIDKDELLPALALLQKAEVYSNDFDKDYWNKDIYKSQYLLYDRLGDTAKAYSYLQKYMKASEAWIVELRNQEIPKAKAREAINRQKSLIAEMEHAQKLQRDRLIILIMAAVVLLLLAVVGCIILYNRIRMRKIENIQLKTNLENEMTIARLNRENFTRDLQKKECEISSSVLLLSNKNDVLQQISEITRQYADDGKIPPDYVNQINEAVKTSLGNDDEWTRFKLHFDSVHPAFFTKLKELSDELTENDLRLCAYIRIGMRSKEIAAMLAVTSASVNSNRYRLRKKLSLAKDDNLEDFIRKI